MTLPDVRITQTSGMILRLEADSVNSELLSRLEPLLLISQDGVPVEVDIEVKEQGVARVALGQGYRLRPDDETLAALERVCGRGSVAFKGGRGG